MLIDKGKKDLPLLKKEIERLERKIPVWTKDLAAETAGLETHLRHLDKTKLRFELASKINKKQRELAHLDQELRRY